MEKIHNILYHCNYKHCKKKFTTKYRLQRHQLKHKGIRKYICEFCGKRFFLFQYLKEHNFIHTGEFPYICDYPECGKRFRQGGKLSLHKKYHDVPVINKVSKNSTKSMEIVKEIDPVQYVLQQIEEFCFPDYFFTKSLDRKSVV